MTNKEVNTLILQLSKLSYKEGLELVLEDKDTLIKAGMEIAIDNDLVALIFTKNFIDEDNYYSYEFNEFGYELLNIVFQALGFKSDFV